MSSREPDRSKADSDSDTKDDILHDGLELNPRDESPPNAEDRGIWKVLGSSTALAILAMVVVGVIALAFF